MIWILWAILIWAIPTGTEAATAYVQGCGNASGAGGTTIACSPGTVTSGNLLVGAVTFEGTTDTVSSCSDGTNSYTIVAATLIRDTTNVRSIEGFYATNVTGGVLTVTCTISSSVARRGIVVHEVSGAATTSPLDKSTGQSQQNPGTGTDAISSTAVTTTTNGQYIFGATGDMAVGCAGVSAGTGFTERNYSTCAGIPIESESQVQSSAGSIAATFTTTDGASDYASIIMTFKAPAASNRPIAPIILSLRED